MEKVAVLFGLFYVSYLVLDFIMRRFDKLKI